MNDARTRKVRAGSDLWHDVRQIYINIRKIHSKLVYVGLAHTAPMTFCGYRILTLQQHAGCHGNGITVRNDVCLIALPVLDDTAHGKVGAPYLHLTPPIPHLHPSLLPPHLVHPHSSHTTPPTHPNPLHLPPVSHTHTPSSSPFPVAKTDLLNSS